MPGQPAVTVITLTADELRRIIREELEAAQRAAPAPAPAPDALVPRAEAAERERDASNQGWIEEARTICSELEQVKRERDEARAELEQVKRERDRLRGRHVHDQGDGHRETWDEAPQAEALSDALGCLPDMASQALENWGHQHQVNKALEEAGEYVTAIGRFRTGGATANELAGECADVIVTALQVAFFAVGPVAFAEILRLPRLRAALAKGGEK